MIFPVLRWRGKKPLPIASVIKMKNRPFLLAIPLVFAAQLVGAAAVTASSDDRVKKLSEPHRSWLEEEVVYIITDRERDVFLSLESIEERERFIEVFWAKRDPNRVTPVNEFKDEHYRRLDHANTFLGRETSREGWRTDRGRYHIILGQPREVQRFDGHLELVSSELWFYQGDPALGITSFFYLLFFKKGDIGEYRLYNPFMDGPRALVRGSRFLSGTHNGLAVQALGEISPELASASLSFDTAEPLNFVSAQPSLSTAVLMRRIEDSPKRAIRTDYADAYLRYKNRVSADYSFNFVPSRNTFSILVGKDATPLVHYSIEIDWENFTLETDEDQLKFYTTLDVTVEVRTSEGVLVMADDKEGIYLELSPSQMQRIASYPFAYQDDFPLVPGVYKVTVILRNRVIKQFTVAETELSIPNFSSGVAIPDVVLAFTSQIVDGNVPEGEVRTYQIGPNRVEPAAGNLFVIGDTVHMLTQAYGASPGDTVKLELVNGEEVLLSAETQVGESDTILEHMKLDGVVAGNYEIRTRVVVASTGEVAAEKRTPITISPRSTAKRPAFGVYHPGFDTNAPGLLNFVRGEQYWNLGHFEEARNEWARSVAENPELPPARWKLASAYLRESQPDRALELLAPLEQAFPTQFDVVAGLGFAHYAKKAYDKAADYLTRALQIRATDTVLLNALGDSHQRLGNNEAASEAFEQSLELDPAQEAVKNRLAALRRRGEP